MKWLTPILPYVAVVAGIYWFQNAWVGLVGFHFAIVISLLLAKAQIPVRLLFKSDNIRWVVLNILLSSISGVTLYFFWSAFGISGNLSVQLEALGLNSSNWVAFIAYFTLVNPFIEEYFWRGYLGSSTNRPHGSDFVYAGFHVIVLAGKTRLGSILYGLSVLVCAGWFWRQVTREDKGLLASVLGHMAADFTILLAVYQKTL